LFLIERKTIKKKKELDFLKSSSFFYERIILSDELTKTNAAEIGIITIRVAKIRLAKNALSEGVIIWISSMYIYI
jgi:hypothetical protein